RAATAGSLRWLPGSASWPVSSSLLVRSSSPASSSVPMPVAITAAVGTTTEEGTTTASWSTGADRRRCSQWVPGARRSRAAPLRPPRGRSSTTTEIGVLQRARVQNVDLDDAARDRLAHNIIGHVSKGGREPALSRVFEHWKKTPCCLKPGWHDQRHEHRSRFHGRVNRDW